MKLLMFDLVIMSVEKQEVHTGLEQKFIFTYHQFLDILWLWTLL